MQQNRLHKMLGIRNERKLANAYTKEGDRSVPQVFRPFFRLLYEPYEQIRLDHGCQEVQVMVCVSGYSNRKNGQNTYGTERSPSLV
jgi:hypothetical protein